MKKIVFVVLGIMFAGKVFAVPGFCQLKSDRANSDIVVEGRMLDDGDGPLDNNRFVLKRMSSATSGKISYDYLNCGSDCTNSMVVTPSGTVFKCIFGYSWIQSTLTDYVGKCDSGKILRVVDGGTEVTEKHYGYEVYNRNTRLERCKDWSSANQPVVPSSQQAQGFRSSYTQQYINCDKELDWENWSGDKLQAKQAFQNGFISAAELNTRANLSGANALSWDRTSSLQDGEAIKDSCYKMYKHWGVQPASTQTPAQAQASVEPIPVMVPGGDSSVTVSPPTQIDYICGTNIQYIGQQNMSKKSGANCFSCNDTYVWKDPDCIKDDGPLIIQINTKWDMIQSLEKSGWTNKDGNFNWFRLGLDAAGGAVLGAGAGILTNTLIKKSQLNKGYESVQCTFNSGTAAYGETFMVR